MNILFLGDTHQGTTSWQRYMALQRLGHSVTAINPKDYLQKEFNNKLLNKFHYAFGYSFVQKKMHKIVSDIKNENVLYDFIFVNSGELLGPAIIKTLKLSGVPIVLYNNDDPTGKRDANRFKQVRAALGIYDLVIVRIEKEEEEFKKFGTKNLMKVYMSYDEVIHKPIDGNDPVIEQYKSDVAFVGTWIRAEKRDDFMSKLIGADIPLSIWGGRWPKSLKWPVIQPHYKGGALGGKNYAAAIQGAKISLGLLSKANRDQHTRRSVEIPFSGGLLCAERTPIHTAMYKEWEEAVFWDSAEECIEVCKKLLADDALRERIRQGGMLKVRELKVGNEDVLQKMIDELYRLNLLK
ncbi:glycosyltransferase [Flavobacterium sp. RHBU_24]|uniref:CgeB family protein n=1 Tax=Flavobacterium sp. RHBU_24 TaxID=3391185 RepID=UPI0039855865